MPVVKLTPYECERNLVPKVCARCGIPADGCVRFTPLSPVLYGLIGLLLVACPPLFVLTAVYLQSSRRRLEVPMCGPHRADWEWRDRVADGSYVLVVCGAYLVALGLAIFYPQAFPDSDWFLLPLGYWLAWCAWVVPVTFMWTRTVRSTGLPDRGIQLSGVHPDFVRALAEDRQRDGRPERLAWFGDDRDDFDEDLSWVRSTRNDPLP